MQGSSVVHVIDDDEAVRDSLEFLLKTAHIDVRTYASAAAFLSALPNVDAGCIVTDVRMPDTSGMDLLRRLNELKIGMPVIVMTGHGDIQLAVEAMKSGAMDFIEKPFDDEQLLSSIQSALRRSKKDAEHGAERSKLLGKLSALSHREREVLDGLIAGKPNKTIAFDLGISPRTVEIYRANVMTKMEAGSLSELVRMALAADLLKTTSDD
jgi:two-component system, LuxR family, response regulator FixJ